MIPLPPATAARRHGLLLISLQLAARSHLRSLKPQAHPSTSYQTDTRFTPQFNLLPLDVMASEMHTQLDSTVDVHFHACMLGNLQIFKLDTVASEK